LLQKKYSGRQVSASLCQYAGSVERFAALSNSGENDRALSVGPITNRVVDQLAKLVEADGLLEVGVHAKAIGFVNIALLAGTAEHNFWDAFVLLMLLEPPENVETGQPRHLQIKNNNIGEGVEDTIGKLALAVQVINGLGAVRDYLKIYIQLALAGTVLQGVPEKRDIILIVLSEEERKTALHKSYPLLGCKFSEYEPGESTLCVAFFK